MKEKLPIIVLVSGNGSNLQAIIDKCQNVKIEAVISNNAQAYAAVRAAEAHITYLVDVPRRHETGDFRHVYDQRLCRYIDMHKPGLIVLAGFMRILSSHFIQQYYGQIINIHPSLLPKYKGLNTHQRVIDNKDKEHGITIHYVTKELDSGPVILQRSFPVHGEPDINTLEKKIHELEHQWYPTVIDAIAAEKIMNLPKRY